MGKFLLFQGAGMNLTKQFFISIKKIPYMKRHSSMNLLSVFFFIVLLSSGCLSEKEKMAEYLNSGKAYFESQDYDSAKIELINAVNLDPDSLEAHRLLAQTYFKLGKGKEAFTEYLRLEQMEPGNIEALTRLAVFFLAAEKHQEAERRINEVLKTDPDNIEALYIQAGIFCPEKGVG